MKSLLFAVAALSSLLAVDSADAGGNRRACRREARCVQNCQPQCTTYCNPSEPAIVDGLPPIEVQQEVIVTKTQTETIIGPDGKPRTVQKAVQATETRTVQLTTANQQIKYLNERLGKLQSEKADLETLKKLEESKVDPLKSLIDMILSTSPAKTNQ